MATWWETMSIPWESHQADFVILSHLFYIILSIKRGDIVALHITKDQLYRGWSLCGGNWFLLTDSTAVPSSGICLIQLPLRFGRPLFFTWYLNFPFLFMIFLIFEVHQVDKKLCFAKRYIYPSNCVCLALQTKQPEHCLTNRVCLASNAS